LAVNTVEKNENTKQKEHVEDQITDFEDFTDTKHSTLDVKEVLTLKKTKEIGRNLNNKNDLCSFTNVDLVISSKR
jgi:hypothetical protein